MTEPIKINPVIQINGGAETRPELYERELYITFDGTLIFGKFDSSKSSEELRSAADITVAKSAQADNATHANTATTAEGINYEGYIHTHHGSDKGVSIANGNPDVDKQYIWFSKANGVQMNQALLYDIGVMTLTSDLSYGTKDPDTLFKGKKLRKGQIYFKIQE